MLIKIHIHFILIANYSDIAFLRMFILTDTNVNIQRAIIAEFTGALGIRSEFQIDELFNFGRVPRIKLVGALTESRAGKANTEKD